MEEPDACGDPFFVNHPEAHPRCVLPKGHEGPHQGAPESFDWRGLPTVMTTTWGEKAPLRLLSTWGITPPSDSSDP